MSVALCHTRYGDFQLAPYPVRNREPLLAWNSADLLLLEQAHALGLHDATVLVVNDTYGALCCALEPAAHWTDSKLSQRAVQRNQQRNGQQYTATLWSNEQLPCVHAALLKIPKQLDYFAYQLDVLARALPQGALLLAAGMDKHLSARSAELIERYFGKAERHRGQKKARTFSAYNERNNNGGSAECENASYYCDILGQTLVSRPNVFSATSVDRGSRLLLQHMQEIEPAQICIDLACGNGVLGLTAFAHKQAEQVVFCDESAMAVASARDNTQRLFAKQSAAFSFYHADGLTAVARGSGELVLCNPPFHRGHTVDDFIGRRLILQSASHLQSGGRLLMVANNHLPYLKMLRRHFSSASKLGGDRQFNVFLAEQR